MAASVNGHKEEQMDKTAAYSISEWIQEALNPLEEDSTVKIKTSVEPVLFASKVLKTLYEANQYESLWTDEKGLNDKGVKLLQYLATTGQYGLDNRYYGAGNITSAVEEWMKNPSDKLKAAEIELSLSNGWLLLALHLHKGAVGKAQFLNSSFGTKASFYADLLTMAAKENKLKENAEALQPVHIHYRDLQKVLSGFYLKKDALPKGFAIRDHKKDSAGCAQDVMTALYYQGYLDSMSVGKEVYQEQLKKFQLDHGLISDGIPGPSTRQLLLLDNKEKFKRVALNLERWRTSGLSFPEEYLLVNIPGFQVHLVKDGQIFKTHKIIVGKPVTPTPELQSAINQVVINPDWTVPQSIIRNEMRGKSASYLSKYDIYQNGVKVSPGQVNWRAGGIRMVQPPGPTNALGFIKLLFPNSHSVYLHDTPSRNLFDTQVRAYSHGCMRMQNPLEMGEYLLKRDGKDISLDSIKTIIATGKMTYFTLSKKMPVFVVYHTAFADANGSLQLYPDIYKKEDLNAAVLFYGKYDKTTDPAKGKMAIPSMGARPEIILPEDSLELAATVIP